MYVSLQSTLQHHPLIPAETCAVPHSTQPWPYAGCLEESQTACHVETPQITPTETRVGEGVEVVGEVQ